MTTAFLGLGSNLGDSEGRLHNAVRTLDGEDGVRVTGVSSVYRTAPFGPVEQPEFLNAVVRIDTRLEPLELLAVAQRIEVENGRKRGVRWGPRTLDIDILLYGDDVIGEPDLVVPHPGIPERAFVLVPLLEVEPEAALPGGTTAKQLLEALGDGAEVTIVPGVVIEW